jgi:hypothetical protein
MKSKEALQIRRDKKRVKEIYGNRCANYDQCGSEETPIIHHIVYRSQEGHGFTHKELENKGNYIPLCWPCERRTHEEAK